MIASLLALMAITLSCSKEASPGQLLPRYKTIYLVRHANAPHVSSTMMDDIERPLDSTGHDQAARMGNYLNNKIENPHHIRISPAQRTIQTTQLLCAAMEYDFTQVEQDSTLYGCTPEVLMNQLINLPNKYATVMIVGHNPVTTQVANLLQNTQHIAEIPPMGVVAIRFEVTNWADISLDNASLSFFATPDNIE